MSIEKILEKYIDEINLIDIIIDYKNSHRNYLKELYLNMKNNSDIQHRRKYIKFLSEEENINFLIENKEYVDWYLFIQNCIITNENFDIIFNILYKEKIAYLIFSFHKIPLKSIESKVKYYTNREWYFIGLTQKLSREFLNKYIHKLSSYCLNQNNYLY